MGKLLIHPTLLTRPYEEEIEPLLEAALRVAEVWGMEAGVNYIEVMCRVQMAEAERLENE